MALSLKVTPGKTFSGGNPGEKVTYSDLNLAASPTVSLQGQATASQIADGAIDSTKIQDGAITTAKLADDNVTNDKLAGGTAGSIRSYDVSGHPTDIAPGTTGYILQSNGAGNEPSWVPINTTVSNVDIEQINGDSATDGSVVSSGGTVYNHTQSFIGTDESISGGAKQQAHGLTTPSGGSVVPQVRWVIKCHTHEHGFGVDAEIPVEHVTFSNSSGVFTVASWADATNVNLTFAATVTGMKVGIAGTSTSLTLSHWDLKPYAYTLV